ncbi:MAG: F0F1 ATP synthase subunit B [Legionella sp.]|nr:F0F1 ATP synthase subunit B [Legionella sp.]
MDINVTLIVQMLVFAAFVWFTMRFVWPPLSKAMEERQNKIADGLAAAERGRKELELAQHRIKEELKQAKVQAAEILEKANLRGAQLIDEAKVASKLAAEKQAKLAEEQLAQAIQRAKDELKNHLADLVLEGTKKILHREVDDASNHALLDTFIEEI